jgi:hypothetical protein
MSETGVFKNRVKENGKIVRDARGREHLGAWDTPGKISTEANIIQFVSCVVYKVYISFVCILSLIKT